MEAPEGLPEVAFGLGEANDGEFVWGESAKGRAQNRQERNVLERVVEDFQKREEVLDFGKIEKVVGGHLHGDFVVAENLREEAGGACG